MPVRQAGFSLVEMLVAMAIGSILLLGTARMLPQIQQHNLRSLMQFQLHEEMQQIMSILEKAVRRAGYCNGACEGTGLMLRGTAETCLLVSWDDNSNGKWEGAGAAESEKYGFRLRDGSLETQRGVDNCQGGGWEKLNDPATIVIKDFQIVQQANQFRLVLTGIARAFTFSPVTLTRRVTAVNL
ncbi:prepilin peptidase-dependent protein [Pantoea sp. FN060301]|uniref:prepilin peptidase-dependent protein n=1 Tax=Pantoea sp. FN060301 TaxID=3420380 RepID=UPI003D17E3D2